MIIWLIGISSAGKTTVGKALVQKLRGTARPTLFLDGDSLREVWQDDLGHEIADRRKNHTRISKLCALLDQEEQADIVVAALSIFPDLRLWNRENFKQYFEVFLDIPIEVAMQRDNRGIYRENAAGVAANVIGVDIPFPVPDADLKIGAPDILQPPEIISDIIMSAMEDRRNQL